MHNFFRKIGLRTQNIQKVQGTMLKGKKEKLTIMHKSPRKIGTWDFSTKKTEESWPTTHSYTCASYDQQQRS